MLAGLTRANTKICDYHGLLPCRKGVNKLENEALETSLIGQSVICLLVINNIKDLAHNAISNILLNSKGLVVVGYINDVDLEDLPKNPRLVFLKIPTRTYDMLENSKADYLPFDNQQFFVLVAYKWELFRILFSFGVTRIIYSDLDVAWFSDLSQILDDSHNANPDVRLFIQSATTNPSNPQLCMGLVSILNDSKTVEMISECFAEHYSRALSGEKIGDDDVISEYYRKTQASWIRELPQSTFPVGMFLNLLERSARFPGLISVKPYMFHANYVVGMANKLTLLQMAKSMASHEHPYSGLNSKQLARLFIKSIRQFRRNYFSKPLR